MGQKTLQAVVVIGGRVDNTFGQIGTALVSMGSAIDEISQKLINFGKESVKVYREYQDSMLDAEVALSTTYGRGTQELAGVMKTLDKQATEWAASTIFHTDDVANAISQAAHANWDLNMILDGIPAAMRLAQAGSMDLSEAVNFIIKSVNGAGLEFRDLNEWIDEWTYAANSSAGDVMQFGEAMLKMGNTMRFAGSKEELLSMLAILHDSGTTGAAAGTLLRNSMIRLIAPTKKATDAMKKLKLTQDDIDEAMSEVDGDTAAAVARLEELGFSVYDDTGELKDFMAIFRDLYLVTKDMSDEDKYAIWSAIFPTKTITGGMALIEGVTKAYDGLFADLESGKAAGYGKYAGEKMMSGLTGSIELFNSKMERLKQITGEALEGDVTYWTDKLGEFVDSVAGLDDASFNALVGGLEVVAGFGPGLVTAGLGFRFLGYALGTNAGRIAFGAMAVVALVNAVEKFNEAKFAENFGDMKLDMEPIKARLDEITAPFNEAHADIDAYVEAMNTAVQTYTDKSSELASGIITKMVTGTELTKEEKDSFLALGDAIGESVKTGIARSYDAVTTSFLQTYGTTGEEVTDPLFQSFMGMMEASYGQAIAKAESLSGELRDALTSGFADGHLTSEEAEKIQSILDEMNELLSMQTSAQNYAERQALMRKAQTLGLEGLEELTTEVNATRDSEIEKIQYDRDLAHGLMEAYLDAHMGEYYGDELIDDDFKAKMLSDIDDRYNAVETERRAAYADILLRAYENALHTSDLADTDKYASDLVQGMLSGETTYDEAISQAIRDGYLDFFRKDGFKVIDKYWKDEIDALGGREAISDMIAEYRENENDEMADALTALLLKDSLYTQATQDVINKTNGYQGYTSVGEGALASDMQQFGPSNIPVSIEGAEETANTARGVMEGILTPAIDTTTAITNAVSAAEIARMKMENIFGTPITASVQVVGGGGGGSLGTINKMETEADGGRATRPALFAEAGVPEWFIPERHDERTAALIAMAADASGFSLAELAMMNGSPAFADGGVYGGSELPSIPAITWPTLDYSGDRDSDSRGTTFDVHYSPTINAQNAEGVERALIEDKERLKKVLRELQEEKELYKSVVSYQ